MRFFGLLGFEDVLIYTLPTLVFIVLLGLSLAYSHFAFADSQRRKETIIYHYPEAIDDRNAPFPLGLFLMMVGTIIWGIFYILGIGIYKVVI